MDMIKNYNVLVSPTRSHEKLLFALKNLVQGE